MADVTVGGVNVSVLRSEGAGHEVEEGGGSRKRMQSGDMRVTVKWRKQSWSFVSVLLNATDRDTLVTALNTAPPITCSGDCLGASFSCAAIWHRSERVSLSGTIWYHVHFSLVEI